MPTTTPSLALPRPIPRSGSALASSVPQYPATFPNAAREPYAYSVDMGVLRSEMAAGNARQRRTYRVQPHALALSFTLRVEELYLWQNWCDAFAYSWFACPVSTMYAGSPPDPANLRYEVLRFTSSLEVEMVGWDLVAVRVAAELSSDAHANNSPAWGTYGWIVAGTPAAPAPDWYVAGEPSAEPPPDDAIAGTATFPAAL